MKKLYIMIAVISFFSAIYGQVPAGFKYQAVARNSSGQLITNTQVNFQIAIIKGSITGSSVYTETFTSTTNNFGIVNLGIGSGTVIAGAFSMIDWGDDTYFIRVWLNGTEMGTSQLLSVPYAMYAKKAETVSNITITGNETAFTAWDKNASDDFNGQYNSLTGVPVLAPVASSGSYFDLTDIPITDGSETKLSPGTNISVTGIGTPDSPYVINSTLPNSAGNFIHYIGELYGGGIVVAVWKVSGIEKGLIASLSDISAGTAWSNVSSVIGITAQSPRNGQANTNAIIAQSGHTSSAAKLCDDYINPSAGTGVFSDWYLPASWELNQCYNVVMILNDVLGDINGFQFAYYWSSTESYDNFAGFQYFDYGSTYFDNKTSIYRVRAVRRF